MNGVINFYKPPGMSSAQAVAFVKYLLKEKTGHAGTLDPEAAGVLPILIGKATRLNDYLSNSPKQYLAEIAFGQATDTQDAQGKTIQSGDSYPDAEQMRGVLSRFTGDIVQLPPQYSALKIGGETAYKLARSGKPAELKARQVVIHQVSWLRETVNHGHLLCVRCGKGTYIRTLCHDIGIVLGCPAHMRFLLREESNGLKLQDAVRPEGLIRWHSEGHAGAAPWLVSIKEALLWMPRYEVPPFLAKPAINGVPLIRESIIPRGGTGEHTKVCLFLGGEPLGIYAMSEGMLRVAVMLHEAEEQGLGRE
jgi:tRNA pseudouridine55 synthase